MLEELMQKDVPSVQEMLQNLIMIYKSSSARNTPTNKYLVQNITYSCTYKNPMTTRISTGVGNISIHLTHECL